MTPLEAIRAKCLDCSFWDAREVKNCPVTKCALHPFRRGRKPKAEKNYSDEEKAQLIARFRSESA